MLRWCGDAPGAERIEAAVADDVAARGAGPVVTAEVGDRIARAVA